jgi:hypothetical protein
LKTLLLLLLPAILPAILFAQDAPTLKKDDQHDHISRSRRDRFDHQRIRPPVKITFYTSTEVTVAYVSNGVLYHETYTRDTDSVAVLSAEYLCPRIEKPCKEFWVLICIHPSHEDKPYLSAISALTPAQIKGKK